MSTHKEGVVIVVGTAERKRIPSHKIMSEPSEEKERWYTVRLFATNSLKEGAM
jgi:hypothetical protein